MMNLNPMNIGSTWQGNFQQPGTAAPAANPAVASYSVGTNMLNISQPIPRYVDPGISAKDDPGGVIRGHL